MSSRGLEVSPELMLRPSLSVHLNLPVDLNPAKVSPELMLRPSLSGDRRRVGGGDVGRVAGAYAPAFVERRPCPVPAAASARVSPELMLRPSLSEE